MEWVADVLPGFEQLTLELMPDDEGPVFATLTRKDEASSVNILENLPESAPELAFGSASNQIADPGADVLYIHGWVDYFHQKHLAAYFESLGFRFYALDLRKYGRSLREWQTPGFTDTLRTYDEDIDAALTAIGHPAPPQPEPSNMPDDDENADKPDTANKSDRANKPKISFAHPSAAKLEFPPPNGDSEKPSTGAIPLVVPEMIRNIIESAKAGFAEATGTTAADSDSDNEGGESAAGPSLADADSDSEYLELEVSGTSASTSSNNEPATPRRRLLLMGHSTGGLIASLWAHFHPDRVDALVLNSPWLEFQTGYLSRRAIEGPVKAQARLAPMSHLVNPDPGYYVRSISNQYDGDWDISPDWKPLVMWPPTAAWMAAIFRVQDRVALGLEMSIPVLVLLSAKSTLPIRWTPELLETDQVITVDDVMSRAPSLGHIVTTVRFPGALHDVVLSTSEVRAEVWKELTRWLAAYFPN